VISRLCTPSDYGKQHQVLLQTQSQGSSKSRYFAAFQTGGASYLQSESTKTSAMCDNDDRRDIPSYLPVNEGRFAAR
jgi:hypothetical protein